MWKDHFLETPLIGLSPPPGSVGSIVLKPLILLLFFLTGLSGLCSSITSTKSSSGGGRLIRSSTTIVSL